MAAPDRGDPLSFLSPGARGAAWMILSCVSFAVLWVLIRILAEELHPFAVVVWRNLLGLLWLAPMLLATPGLLKVGRWRGHARRATSGVIATFATFYAVATAPLAPVLAINYTAPLFATIGAVLFLGERIRLPRTMALVIGFSGMLLVLRPGEVPLTAGLYAAMISALATAFSLVAVKALTRQDDARAVAAWSFILMTPLSILVAWPFWSWPRAELWPLLAGLGAAAASGQIALSRAFAAVDASAVMPFDFVRFALITLAGILLFGERYDAMTLLGGAIILSSTILLAVRERQRRCERSAHAPDT